MSIIDHVIEISKDIVNSDYTYFHSYSISFGNNMGCTVTFDAEYYSKDIDTNDLDQMVIALNKFEKIANKLSFPIAMENLENGKKVLMIDKDHAIDFQCLDCNNPENIEKIDVTDYKIFIRQD